MRSELERRSPRAARTVFMPHMTYPFDAHLVREAPTREIAAHCNGRFPISIQFVYFFQFIVPVVQRIEQGFPNPKASPSHGKILFREAARTRQNQPMADNYLVITGNRR